MIYLVLGIAANAILFLAFRSFTIFRIDNLQAIVVNYIVCVITGILFIGRVDVFWQLDLSAAWFWVAILLGLLLVAGFYVASLTSQQLGVSVTSVSSKMSLAFPVIFSLLVLKVATKDFSWLNYSGIALALAAIYLSSIREGFSQQLAAGKSKLWLPFSVFLFGGLIDILINYSNHSLLKPENIDAFTIMLFVSAAFFGAIALLLRQSPWRWRSVAGGIYLGIPNYFSLFFVLKALSAFQNNGAVFYPIYNVGIILLSTVLAVLIFKEKLLMINLVGLALSALALFLLSYQEIIEYIRDL